MGCGGSKKGDKSPTPEDGPKKSGLLNRAHKVNVKVGSGVKMTENQPRVIFVFGGPGTKKGRILDNLSHVFGMEVINVENLIIENLSKKVEDPEPERIVPMVQELLKREEQLLRLDHVLRMVSRAIAQKPPDKIVLVDFVPNLKWMLNNTYFIKECEADFKYFEVTYPISFVMHFLADKDKVGDQLKPCTVKPPPAAETSNSQKAGGAATQKAAPPKQSDEADSSRTQKRIAMYQNSIRHFLDFFQHKDNIVSIDVSCGQKETIWLKVCEFFSRFDFHSTKIVESVIIFGFDQRDLDDIDIQRYTLTVIKLKDIVKDPHMSVDLLLDELCRYIDHSDPSRRVFAVDGTNTKLTKDLKKLKSKKCIQFHDSGEECRLSKYCNVALTNKGDPVSLQAVSSIQNEVCLFPKNASPGLCRWIAGTMAESRNKPKT